MSTIHPLSDARKALQEGSITARELLERHLSVMDKIEPDVRAMVTITVDRARQQAIDEEATQACGAIWLSSVRTFARIGPLFRHPASRPR